MKKPLQNIPTTVISGFLGVGKTSAILHLLTQKPANETWAVLVNEFGKIGIDGALYAAKGVAVREIAGGCMCCATGVQLQVTINQLLKDVRPDRLLIELSGLGHPKRVMDSLRGQYFQSVLDIRATICLLDPQKLSESRYTTHETFIDQIALADVLIANKTDLASKADLHQFERYVQALQPKKWLTDYVQFGRLPLAWLDVPCNIEFKAFYPEHYAPDTQTATLNKSDDDYHSQGWTFDKTSVFDFDLLMALGKQLKLERFKAIVLTDKGWYLFNGDGQQFTAIAVPSAQESRIEVIAYHAVAVDLEQKIRACLLSHF